MADYTTGMMPILALFLLFEGFGVCTFSSAVVKGRHIVLLKSQFKTSYPENEDSKKLLLFLHQWYTLQVNGAPMDAILGQLIVF